MLHQCLYHGVVVCSSESDGITGWNPVQDSLSVQIFHRSFSGVEARTGPEERSISNFSPASFVTRSLSPMTRILSKLGVRAGWGRLRGGIGERRERLRSRASEQGQGPGDRSSGRLRTRILRAPWPRKARPVGARPPRGRRHPARRSRAAFLPNPSTSLALSAKRPA
jgi:hypothetical protein